MIENRVANSSLVSIDMDEFLDTSEPEILDLKDQLFQGMVLREKDFREYIKETDWSQYHDKRLLLTCSVDAIIPAWAYMLITSKLQPHVNVLAIGTLDDLEKETVLRAIERITDQDLSDSKVVIKGCGDLKNRDYAYSQLTKKLVPIVKSIMYGEPCSTVPVYKRPRVK